MEIDPKQQDPQSWSGDDVEVEYFGEERKQGKKERKILLAKDRSQYKKTDRAKKAQEKELSLKEDNLIKGRVLSIASQVITVEAAGTLWQCTLRGVLKKEKTEAKNLVTVGDFVLMHPSDAACGQIVHIEPRRSVLFRQENLSRKKLQLIAANIDQVIITVSVVSPQLKPSLIDRYIIAAHQGHMDPVIVINKLDLLGEGERDVCDNICSVYKDLNIPIIGVSYETGEGIDHLKQLMKDKVSVFSGQSGVGKSSLINAITGSHLRVGNMVEKTNKGTHTTTSAKLLRLIFGGWCIDTPGIKSFGVWDLKKEDVKGHFTEIFKEGCLCRYSDCSHTGEEGCHVIKCVEEGAISPFRYESYCALLDSISEEHYRR